MQGATRETVLQYAAEQFHTKPEYLFRGSPQTAVLRHSGSRKWFGIIMPVAREKLGLNGSGTVDVVNVKCDPLMLGSLLSEPGFLPAYHMAKHSWVSILLDGSVDAAQVTALLHMSHTLVSEKQKRRPAPKKQHA